MRKIATALFLVAFAIAPLFSGGSSGCSPTTQNNNHNVTNFILQVILSGSGTVTSSPAGIDCGSDCSESYASGTSVALTAAPAAGFVFSGWSGGGCSGTGHCTVSLTADTQVTATFTQAKTLSLTVGGAGSGSASSQGGEISCAKSNGTCTKDLAIGTALTLTATPDAGYLFAGWSGAGCKGTATCTVTLNDDQSVRATFIMVVFSSREDLNGNSTDLGVANVWVATTDGAIRRAITRMTAANADSFGPQWSPDGTKIVFYSQRALDKTNNANTNNTENIWVIDADDPNDGDPALTTARSLTQITALNADSENPQWSLDGTQVVFDSKANVDRTDALNTNEDRNIWIANVDGSGALPLTLLTTTRANNENPQWSPDGTKIVFDAFRNLDGSNTDSTTTHNIWIMNADGSVPTPLGALSDINADSTEPQWSPDGTKIVFRSRRDLNGNNASNAPNGVFNIWIVNADGTGLAHLTDQTLGANHFDAQWSPDGTKMIFDSQRALDGTDAFISASNIWTMNPDGTGPLHLTDLTIAGVYQHSPQWTPDGTMIVFKSTRALDSSNAVNANCTYNTWMMNADGTGPTPLTRLTVGGHCGG